MWYRQTISAPVDRECDAYHTQATPVRASSTGNEANTALKRLSAANLDGADLRDVLGRKELRSISHACIDNIRNTPPVLLISHLARVLSADTLAAQRVELSEYSREFRAI